MIGKNLHPALVSNCCGAPNRSNGDTDLAEFGICPDCYEYCEFVDDSDDLDEEGPIYDNTFKHIAP